MIHPSIFCSLRLLTLLADLHLALGHAQLLGQLGPVGAGQVLCLLKLLLQHADLLKLEERGSYAPKDDNKSGTNIPFPNSHAPVGH